DSGVGAVGSLPEAAFRVHEVAVEPSGQAAPDRGLAGAHEPHEHDVLRHRQSGATKASRLRRSSTTESPPNLRDASSASTSATIVSATTPMAGTAVTSV